MILIEKYPVDQIHRDKINEQIDYVSKYLPNLWVSAKLIKYAVTENYKSLEDGCREVCYNNFIKTGSPEFSQTDHMTATHLLHLYYSYRGHSKAASFFLSLCKYLYKVGHTKNDLGQFVEYYLAKINRFGKADVYLPLCVSFCKIVLKYQLGDYPNHYQNHERLVFYPSFKKSLQRLLDDCKKYERWDDYCITVRIILNGQVEANIQKILGDLIEHKTLINKKVWAKLPIYLSKYETINNFCENSFLYSNLLRINMHKLNKVDDYITRVCVCSWTHNHLLAGLRLDSGFKDLVNLILTKKNAQLMLLVQLITDGGAIDLYKNNCRVSGKIVIRYENIRPPTKCPLFELLSELWTHVYSFNKAALIENLTLIFEDEATHLFSKIKGDAELFMFWYMLTNYSLKPTLIVTNKITSSNLTDRITIKGCRINPIVCGLEIWENVYNSSRKSLEVYRSTINSDVIKLKDFVGMLTRINKMHEIIINKLGGIDYLSMKRGFEGDNSAVINTSIPLEKLLEAFIRGYNKCANFKKSELLSNDQHLVFICLSELGYADHKQQVIATSFLTFPIIVTLIRCFIKLEKKHGFDKFTEICVYYYEQGLSIRARAINSRRTYDVKITIEIFTHLLLSLCHKVNYCEGTFELMSLVIKHNLRVIYRDSSVVYKSMVIQLASRDNHYDTSVMYRFLLHKIKILISLSKRIENFEIVEPQLASIKKIRDKLLSCEFCLPELIEGYNNFKIFEKFVIKLIRLEPPRT